MHPLPVFFFLKNALQYFLRHQMSGFHNVHIASLPDASNFHLFTWGVFFFMYLDGVFDRSLKQ